MAPDPFQITGPAVILFSGGRSSAYMLRRVLDAHGGRLPADVVACFANTGREHEGTLAFVRDCATHWNVPIHWIEFRCGMRNGKMTSWAEEVTFETASRNGEPFEALLRMRGYLPNPVFRFCTTELKLRPIRRWFEANYKHTQTWTNVVGLRADEPRRVERLLNPAREHKAGREGRNVIVPLFDAGVTKQDVLEFWAQQPFDLRLAGEWEGNCDGCMLKRKATIARLWRDYPERAAWWARMEEEAKQKHGDCPRSRFRKDWRNGYAGIRAELLEGRARYLRELASAPTDSGFDVFAACEEGCGV